MPREPSFSKADVLERLTDAFSTHGYEGASLAVLQEASGLGKQSLYNTFGDKQAMYLEALGCAAQRGAHGAAVMQAAADARMGLALYFDLIVQSCASPDPGQQNCIVTGGLLQGLDDARLVQALTARWQVSYELLRSTVERGQRDGSIVNPAPSADLAELLIGLIAGLRVAAQVGRSKAQMEGLVSMTLGVLDRA